MTEPRIERLATSVIPPDAQAPPEYPSRVDIGQAFEHRKASGRRHLTAPRQTSATDRRYFIFINAVYFALTQAVIA
jgi:hypothetical protein